MTCAPLQVNPDTLHSNPHLETSWMDASTIGVSTSSDRQSLRRAYDRLQLPHAPAAGLSPRQLPRFSCWVYAREPMGFAPARFCILRRLRLASCDWAQAT
jgi:hypothetical protein